MSKRDDLLRGALEVFARDGYSRAGIADIAAAAGVSTRTIYNQFGGKATLFAATIRHSADAVADSQIDIVRRHLSKIVDLEEDLVAFGTELVSPTQFTAHFELVRQINAEANHIPQDALDAWRKAGPARVQSALADHLKQISERGLLDIDHAPTAASQLMLLVAGEADARTFHGLRPLPSRTLRRIVERGVRTFLYGWSPRPDEARG